MTSERPPCMPRSALAVLLHSLAVLQGHCQGLPHLFMRSSVRHERGQIVEAEVCREGPEGAVNPSHSVASTQLLAPSTARQHTQVVTALWQVAHKA